MRRDQRRGSVCRPWRNVSRSNTSRRRLYAILELPRRKPILGVAEFAGDGETAVRLAHIVELGGVEALEKHLDPRARAAAARHERCRSANPDALLVEEAIEQASRRQR